MAPHSSANRSRLLQFVEAAIPNSLVNYSGRMYRTSPIKSGQISVREGKQLTTRAGTIVGAVRFAGNSFSPGDVIAIRYDYYSGSVPAVHPLASINMIAGYKE